MAGCSGGREGKKTLLPKPEVFDYDDLPPPSYASFSGHARDNVASSSGGNLRLFFIGMGFSPSLVDKAIEENGEENSDLLLEVLLTYSSHKSNSDSSGSLEGSLNTNRGRSAPNFCPDSNSKEALQKSNSQSSDSLDSLFGDKDCPEISTVDQIKEEPDKFTEFIDEKRGSLLMMNFSAEEVDFAIHKLGMQASVPDLVDFIFAAQIAKKMKRETIDITSRDTVNEISNEKLFGILAKTLQLLEMGFSENEVSSAIDTLGTEVPISELANFIFAEQSGVPYVMQYKYPTTSAYTMGIKTESVWDLHIPPEVKVESFSDEPLQSRQVNIGDSYLDNGKRVKEEDAEEFPDGVSGMRFSDFLENDRGKRPKYEYDDAYDDSSSFLDTLWMEEKVDPKVARMSELHKSNPCRRVGIVAEKSPFFLYGNVSNIPYESWEKMSQFIYGVDPEFVNTESFSSLNRIEGYIHNLPVEGRAHILPKSPMTIEDAMPRTKKWWPPWDSRKQLSSICCETSGISRRHCDRLGRILAESGGVPTYDQQNHIIRCCNALNLVWTGKYKLSPIDPEKLELILGYPVEHTASESDLAERLQLLKYCFQTDTLAYHLSVLKPLFPNGLTMLSLFSGIGGAEIALHRLGIKMKAVVSVETSEAKRKILERWWRTSGQKGNLVQVEDIQRLNSRTLQGYISKFGAFDLVIYQHPCSYASSRVSAGGRIAALDFSLFVESVRLLQRVRGLSERR